MKEQLVQWLSNLDYSKFFAIVIAFLSSYGALLAGLVIGIVKTRITKTKLDEKLGDLEIHLNEKQLAYAEKQKQEIIEALGKVQEELITQNVKAQEKRLELISGLKEDAEETIEEIKKISVDDVLNTLDE